MNHLTRAIFNPSYQQNHVIFTPRITSIMLFSFSIIFIVLGYFTLNINTPFDIATLSRALYVDEGFYSDAAQNFVKTGQFGLPYDLRHWPGAPMLTFIQAIAFSVFGVSLAVARLISIAFAVISLLCIYSIARMKLSPAISLLLSIAAVLTISFTTHSRVAIADPIAVGFSLLALLVYVRLTNKSWAIPLSLILAYFSFCSKMYFLFSFITIAILWLMELIILPYFEKTRINRRLLYLFIISLVLIIASYIVFRVIFNDSFIQFFSINSNKKPVFDFIRLFNQLIISLKMLVFNTKTNAFLISIVMAVAFFIIKSLFDRSYLKLRSGFYKWGREGWALSLYLVLGICTVAALNLPHKSHYQYFAILPICCIAIFSLKMIIPNALNSLVIASILIGHLFFQAFLYTQWLNRADNTSINEASNNLIKLIEYQNSDDYIPVIGQYASQLALNSNRIIPLDVRWSTKEQLCQRLTHWKPKFLISFFFPKRGTYEKNLLMTCQQIDTIQEISRFTVFEKWKDELVLYQLVYKN